MFTRLAGNTSPEGIGGGYVEDQAYYEDQPVSGGRTPPTDPNDGVPVSKSSGGSFLIIAQANAGQTTSGLFLEAFVYDPAVGWFQDASVGASFSVAGDRVTAVRSGLQCFRQGQRICWVTTADGFGVSGGSTVRVWIIPGNV